MDISQLLSAIPAALAPIALVLYFNNQNTQKWMDERREIALAILTERKEFVTTQQHLLERYDVRLVAAVDAASKVSSELHRLNGIQTQFMLKVDAMGLQIQALSKGSSANG